MDTSTRILAPGVTINRTRLGRIILRIDRKGYDLVEKRFASYEAWGAWLAQTLKDAKESQQ